MRRAATLAAMCGLIATTAGAGGMQTPPRGVAYAVVELSGGQVVQSRDLERLQRPTALGTIPPTPSQMYL